MSPQTSQAFSDNLPGALTRHGKAKVEITCTGCDGHIGHVFKSSRYPKPKHERHCANSVSLVFEPVAEVEAPAAAAPMVNTRPQRIESGPARAAAAIVIQKHFRGRSAMLGHVVRGQLEAAPKADVAAACDAGLDGMASLCQSVLGTNVWQRAVVNAPDEWEEEEMVTAMRDALTHPKTSAHMWLLAKLTKFERALLKLSAGVTGKRHAASAREAETRAAIVVQKAFRGHSAQLTVHVRLALEAINPLKSARACSGGLDAMASFVSQHLGTNVWQRAVVNAPDDWEEEQMEDACAEVILRPRDSPHLWLFSKPTKHEKQLLKAFKAVQMTAKI